MESALGEEPLEERALRRPVREQLDGAEALLELLLERLLVDTLAYDVVLDEIGRLGVRVGAAQDYVLAMQAALQHDEPGDFIIATGRLHSLKDLLELAFAAAGVADPWAYVQQDEALLRAADAPGLTGDPGKAQRELGWTAVTSFDDLVAEMVRVDLERLRSGVEESPDYV